MDFVVGIEIKLSNNHTLNGVPFTDICDTLAGKYPKDFKFTGWHPLCRCRAVTILKTEEEMAEDTKRILAGQQTKKGSVNAVRDVPAAFKGWVEEHSDRIKNARNLPYFIKDNRKRVDSILGIAAEPQKTPLEIAKERHDARTPEQAAAIQQRWNETRLQHLAEAIDNGYLPKEVKEQLGELLAINRPEHFEEINSRIATFQKAVARHKAMTPQQIEDIKKAWKAKQKRDATTKLIANNILKLRSEYPHDVDFSALEKLIAQNNLTKMQQEARNVAQAIKTIRADYKTMSAYLDNVHEWHKTFSLAELKQVYYAVDDKMMKWELQGIEMTTNAEKLKSKLEFEIQWLEKNKKHTTWQVAQDAYKKKLQEVETHIELTKLNAEYTTLLGFKTTSKDFKDFMAKAKAAIDAGDLKKAEFYLNNAQYKKDSLEAKRSKGKFWSSVVSKSGQFGNDAYTKKRKDAAMWAQNTVEADRKLRDKCGEVWRNSSSQERNAIYGYTESYHNINEPLRGLKYVGSASKTKEGLDRIPYVESIINKSSYDFDMWLQRGDGMIALKKFGLANWDSATDAEIMSLLGAEGVEGAFWSAGVAKGKGFSGDIIFNIYAPKGTKAMYCEPFSAYGHGSGKSWNGIASQGSFGHESEILIQRGTKFKITKIEKSGGQWYIDVDIIEQHPVQFPYIGGYPFK